MTIILKKDGVEIMGEHRLPNPLPWWVEHVIQATKEAQRDADAFTIEDDAIAQLEADDRFDEQVYTVDELVDLVPRLRADCECCRDVIESGLLTENVKLLLETHWHICEVELRRLKGARVVV